jgi:hypothetical protein
MTRSTQKSNFGHVSVRVGKETSAVMVWGPASIKQIRDMLFALQEYFQECVPESHFYKTGQLTGEQVVVINLHAEDDQPVIELDDLEL